MTTSSPTAAASATDPHPTTDPIPVAVIGVGRMGRHHARIYHSLPQAKLVAVVDANLQRAQAMAADYQCAAYASVQELIALHPEIKAVSVAVPTAWHAKAAEPLLAKRIACLIEKPLAATAQLASELADFAQRHQAVLQVGHTERFNPAVRAVAAMNITPRFMDVQRVSPMTFRSLDVGVVMDMMIHDIDIVLMLADSTPVDVQAVGVKVLGQHEDIANARLVFANGCVANITASRLALKTERRMRLFSESAYVSLDYQKRDGVVIRQSKQNMQNLAEVRQMLEQGKDLSGLEYSKLVEVSRLEMDLPADQQDPLTAELCQFLQAALGQSRPAVDGQAGQAAVEVAQRIVQAIHQHRWPDLQPLP